MTKLLLKNKANVNGKNLNDVRTPLHQAVINGNIPIIEALMSEGADAFAKDKVGITPFLSAEMSAKADVLNFLKAKIAERVNKK